MNLYIKTLDYKASRCSGYFNATIWKNKYMSPEPKVLI